MRNPKLHVLLSQADAKRFGLPDAGHSTLPLAQAQDAGLLALLMGNGFTAVEVPATFEGGEAEIPAGRVLREPGDLQTAEGVFMFRTLVGG